jgi:hypothetical protein
METKLEFFKKYCKLKRIENEYAFGVVADSGNRIDFLNGESSTYLMYNGRYIKHGQLYEVYEATCGGSCTIGIPKTSCVENGCYSKTKCAVYFYDAVDVENFKYELSYEELQILGL